MIIIKTINIYLNRNEIIYFLVMNLLKLTAFILGVTVGVVRDIPAFTIICSMLLPIYINKGITTICLFIRFIKEFKKLENKDVKNEKEER